MTQQVRCLCAVVLMGIISCCVGIRGASGDGRRAAQTCDPNELTWGHVYRGLAISICPRQAQYALGEEIEIAVFLKNLRTEEFFMQYDKYARFYRMAMFDSEGRPVERTESLRSSEASVTTPGQRSRVSMRSIRVPPGPGTVWPKRDAQHIVSLYTWFKIEKTGTYTLIVMQPIAREGFGTSWKDGFLISNAVKISIVAR